MPRDLKQQKLTSRLCYMSPWPTGRLCGKSSSFRDLGWEKLFPVSMMLRLHRARWLMEHSLTHITSAHVFSSVTSPMSTPNFKGPGKCHPTKGLEEQETDCLQLQWPHQEFKKILHRPRRRIPPVFLPRRFETASSKHCQLSTQQALRLGRSSPLPRALRTFPP